MKINLTDRVKELLQAFFLLILPLVTIVLGMVFNIENALVFCTRHHIVWIRRDFFQCLTLAP